MSKRKEFKYKVGDFAIVDNELFEVKQVIFSNPYLIDSYEIVDLGSGLRFFRQIYIFDALSKKISNVETARVLYGKA